MSTAGHPGLVEVEIGNLNVLDGYVLALVLVGQKIVDRYGLGLDGIALREFRNIGKSETADLNGAVEVAYLQTGEIDLHLVAELELVVGSAIELQTGRSILNVQTFLRGQVVQLGIGDNDTLDLGALDRSALTQLQNVGDRSRIAGAGILAAAEHGAFAALVELQVVDAQGRTAREAGPTEGQLTGLDVGRQLEHGGALVPCGRAVERHYRVGDGVPGTVDAHLELERRIGDVAEGRGVGRLGSRRSGVLGHEVEGEVGVRGDVHLRDLQRLDIDEGLARNGIVIVVGTRAADRRVRTAVDYSRLVERTAALPGIVSGGQRPSVALLEGRAAAVLLVEGIAHRIRTADSLLHGNRSLRVAPLAVVLVDQREGDDTLMSRRRLVGRHGQRTAALTAQRGHVGPALERGGVHGPCAVRLDGDLAGAALTGKRQRGGRCRQHRRRGELVVVVRTARECRGGKREQGHEQQLE